tara:strand:+ start:3989 stop:4363 length:375 start_codon:yes stop_codon:yes gene_type:complete
MKNATSSFCLIASVFALMLFGATNSAQAVDQILITLSYTTDGDVTEYLDGLKAIEAKLADKFDLKFDWNGNTITVSNDTGSVGGTITFAGNKLDANITLAPKLKFFSKVIKSGLDKEFRNKLSA